jgi:hypothetical protein
MPVRNGTPLHHGESLCATCSQHNVMRGRSMSEERHTCDTFGVLRFPVTFCNAYNDARIPNRHELESTAWMLVRDKKGRQRFVDRQEYYRLREANEVY